MTPHAIAFLVLPAAAYLLGAIPFGLLIGLSRGVDVRSQGSGNIGATNVWRILGRRYGIACLGLDVLKGFLPVFLTRMYLSEHFFDLENNAISETGQWAWLCVAGGAIFGHMFSMFLKFKGGKGVATSLGVLIGVWPYFTLASLIALAAWMLVWAISRYVSLASIVAAALFPLGFLLLTWQIDQWRFASLWPLFAFSCVTALLIILRHRSNIARLLAGTELKNQPK
jgi:glycerol-3-phosphate acyltransferase PlsY